MHLYINNNMKHHLEHGGKTKIPLKLEWEPWSDEEQRL